MNDSETREELVKSAHETSALIQETTQIFRQSISIYFSRVAEQIRAAGKKQENGKISAAGQKELAVVADEISAVLDMISRHKFILQRALKVVVHKNEAKAYERLRVALDRMKEESERYQKQLRRLANAK
jgi:hypothetical protein